MLRLARLAARPSTPLHRNRRRLAAAAAAAAAGAAALAAASSSPALSQPTIKEQIQSIATRLEAIDTATIASYLSLFGLFRPLPPTKNRRMWGYMA